MVPLCWTLNSLRIWIRTDTQNEFLYSSGNKIIYSLLALGSVVHLRTVFPYSVPFLKEGLIFCALAFIRRCRQVRRMELCLFTQCGEGNYAYPPSAEKELCLFIFPEYSLLPNTEAATVHIYRVWRAYTLTTEYETKYIRRLRRITYNLEYLGKIESMFETAVDHVSGDQVAWFSETSLSVWIIIKETLIMKKSDLALA